MGEEDQVEKLKAQLQAAQRQTQRFKNLYAETVLERDRWKTRSQNQHKNLSYLNRKLRTLYDGMKMASQPARAVPVTVEI